MKIALIGYGKMGRMVEKTAKECGHQIVSIISPSQRGNTISRENVEDAEVCIEFTRPERVVENVSRLASMGKNVVIGTTGWYAHLDEVKALAKKHHVGLFFAANFSLGMNLFIKVLQEAAKTILPTGQYDVAGVEAHHNQKIDTPSATAKFIAQSMAESCGERIEIPFTSMRCGSIPGIHTVLFDSSVDTITLTHTARNREGFAKGAISAAEWLKGKKGFFTMEDLLASRQTREKQ
jgi:4-hydroxy-tetrahydrodipicolinate reductase